MNILSSQATTTVMRSSLRILSVRFENSHHSSGATLAPCVLAGVQWDEGGLMGRRSHNAQMSVPGASTGLMRCRLQLALRNSTRNSHNARAC